jgi:hypothetical protein
MCQSFSSAGEGAGSTVFFSPCLARVVHGTRSRQFGLHGPLLLHGPPGALAGGPVSSGLRRFAAEHGLSLAPRVRSNPSIERTHNGGAQLRASATPRAPLWPAHVER